MTENICDQRLLLNVEVGLNMDGLFHALKDNNYVNVYSPHKVNHLIMFPNILNNLTTSNTSLFKDIVGVFLNVNVY